MSKDLSNYRKSYTKGELLLKSTPNNPIHLFESWFNEVDTYFNEGETNAMTISTIGLDGFPKSRVVLLKKISATGFVFYTNYDSEKGKAILKNPNVCLSFFWSKAERQVIIKGKASKISEKESDVYFKSRPHGSQLGALVSNQSKVINNREELDLRLQTLKLKYEGKEIPRPNNWGGFVIEPFEIEFWQGRPNRLHDRIRFKKSKNSAWDKQRLEP